LICTKKGTMRASEPGDTYIIIAAEASGAGPAMPAPSPHHDGAPAAGVE
jgi:hypothetical protein